MEKSSQQPVNFDFHKHWELRIKPHLEDVRVKRAIRKGVDAYLNKWPNNEEVYKANTAPAAYSSKDAYAVLCDRKEDMIMDRLRDEGKLPEWFLEIERKWKTAEDDSEDDEDYTPELMKAREKLLEPYNNWNAIKYNLETYYLSGSCHWYAPTFELTLARLVCPNEKWRVMSSDVHSTVINQDNTKVFDLLYWANDGRLENHVFGDKIEIIDPTLGGAQAYKDAVAQK